MRGRGALWAAMSIFACMGAASFLRCKTVIVKPTIAAEVDNAEAAIVELSKLPPTPETLQAIKALRGNVVALREMDAVTNEALKERDDATKRADKNQSAASTLHWLIGIACAAGAALVGFGGFKALKFFKIF